MGRERVAIDRSRYADTCDGCLDLPLVMPALLLTAPDGRGLVADYLCPDGHTWMTGWGWWAGAPHATDGRAAA